MKSFRIQESRRDARHHAQTGQRLHLPVPGEKIQVRNGRGPPIRFFGANHADIYIAALLDQFVNQSPPAEETRPESHQRFSGDDLGDIVLARDSKESIRGIIAQTGDGFRAQFAGERQIPDQSFFLFLGQRLGSFDIGGHPPGIHGGGDPPRPANERFRIRAGADRHQQPFPGFPGSLYPVRGHGLAHVLSHLFGCDAQRDLSKRGQIFLAEKMVGRRGGAFAQIDFAVGQPLAQILGGDVHQLQIVGPIQHGIRYGFPDGCPDNLSDHIHAAFDMLNIECGINVDARIEQL